MLHPSLEPPIGIMAGDGMNLTNWPMRLLLATSSNAATMFVGATSPDSRAWNMAAMAGLILAILLLRSLPRETWSSPSRHIALGVL